MPLEVVAAAAAQVSASKVKLAQQVRDRDLAVRAAYKEGSTIAELSRVTGLTRTMLYKIIEKEPNA